MRIITFLITVLLLSNVCDAQTFTVQYAGAAYVHAPMVYVNDSTVKGPMNQDDEDTAMIITNISGSAINIDLIRLENNIPAGWFNEMCLDICYAPPVDSIGVAIPKGGSQPILLHFFTFSAQSQCGNVKLKIKNDDDPSEYLIHSFYICSDSTLSGIAENNMDGIPIKVFPNPFTSTAVVSLKNYRAQHGSLPLDFNLYDLLGNLVMTRNGIREDQIIINRNGLHSGIYFYKLMNGNKEETMGRVSIQ